VATTPITGRPQGLADGVGLADGGQHRGADLRPDHRHHPGVVERVAQPARAAVGEVGGDRRREPDRHAEGEQAHRLHGGERQQQAAQRRRIAGVDPPPRRRDHGRSQ
jgi:hypothetical protein